MYTQSHPQAVLEVSYTWENVWGYKQEESPHVEGSQPPANLSSLCASNRQISLPLTLSLCDFNGAEVNITPLNQSFLFICAEEVLWCQHKRGENAKFCLSGLSTDPTCFGSGSILHRWATISITIIITTKVITINNNMHTALYHL